MKGGRMAIRLRQIDGVLVALCAASTEPEPGDRYLDDEEDHALRVKFDLDMESEGVIEPLDYLGGHPDAVARRIIRDIEKR